MDQEVLGNTDQKSVYICLPRRLTCTSAIMATAYVCMENSFARIVAV